jgi:hypothetical protein
MDDETALLTEYFEELRATPRLTPLEESDLLAAARRGQKREEGSAAENAKNKVIRGYLPVTALLALHLAPAWMSRLEAIQEANIVLMRLVKDPSVPRPLAAALTSALVKRYAERNEPGDFDDPEGGSRVRVPRQPNPTSGAGSVLLPNDVIAS